MPDSSFIPDRQLAFSPELACAIGLEEAILHQYLNELLAHRPARRRGGFDWLQVDCAWLANALPFWPLPELRRVLSSLVDKGMVLANPPLRPDSACLVFALNNPGPAARRAPAQGPRRNPPGHRHGGQPQAAGRALPAAPDFSAPAPHSPGSAPAPHSPGSAPAPLPPGWAPSEDMLRLLELSHGIPRQFSLDVLEDFVCYWRERGDASHAWENKFRQHALNRWRAAEQAQAEAYGPAGSSAALDQHWRPNAEALELLAGSGIPRAFIDAAVPEFILYWREHNPRERALNAKFLQHVKYQWAQQSNGGGTDGQQQQDSRRTSRARSRTSGTRERSIESHLSDRSWAH